MNVEQKTEEAVFKEAIKLESPAERAAFVRQACGSDTRLLSRLEILLQAHDEAGDFLETPPVDVDVVFDNAPLSEAPGTVIGRYKLLERIGEGGMAVVYMAEQQEPIRRKVALKIIKLGMDTRQVIARFEAERQALAMMDHPSIAKVLDAGATETGRPYFVMELVTGVSITEYCDKNNLSTKDRLALFIQVCIAVQHAHQKGIIHRDIKPSNVMVTHHDGQPLSKVIDFGIAKATNQRLTEKTLFTRYAHIIGTPAYMSPEQAELSDVDIDTRSDIYSLGVLLYELLTGTTPFSEEELREAGYTEMQRIIREQEPTKPSTKLSTLGDTLTEIAKCRSSTPDLLRRSIQGDLDWIVMKSLEKDRARRYETVNGLAEDIRRHLESEPVVARGPSTLYRLHKSLRRNRSRVLGGLAVVVTVASVTAALSLWHRARQQLADVEAPSHRAILSQARGQYAMADRLAALKTVKPILRSRYVGPEAQLLYAGILVEGRRPDEATRMLSDLVNERPEIAGAAHSLLARILWESQSSKADKLSEIQEHRRKTEALLPETAEAYFLQAMTALTIKEQLTWLGKALELDPQHYESLRLRAYIYYASRKYDRLRDDALVMTVLRPGPVSYSLHAIALRELGLYPDALREYDRAIASRVDDGTDRCDLAVQHCDTLLRMASYDQVIADAQDYANRWPNNPILQYQIFCASTALGDYDKASTLFRQIVSPGEEARRQFRNWCMKHVFDVLHAGKCWHPADRMPTGAAFLPMIEAEETYRTLSAKGRLLMKDCGGGQWSPDGKKFAFDLGLPGYRGLAIFDPATDETDLLIVPGKDEQWSPDGKHIAFVRYCEALRLDELVTAEREDRDRPPIDEEVWIMNADGTEPRRLARGGWPRWSQDSTEIYYHSRTDQAIYSIPIAGAAEPKRIISCQSDWPNLSQDKQRVAYVDYGALKVKDVTSQSLIAEWPIPFGTWGGSNWSPTNEELCMAGQGNEENRSGLWIFSLDGREPVKILAGQLTWGYWAPDGRSLQFSLGTPYFETWTVDVDPNVSVTETLGPARTTEEYLEENVAFYTRRIETDPQDLRACFERGMYYDRLGEREKANADVKRWQILASGRTSPDPGAEPPAPYTDLVFGKAENLGSTVNSADNEYRCCLSPDGLELYFSSDRPGGCGSFDIWVTKRASVQDPWGVPTNLGPQVNTLMWDAPGSVSADGLTLDMDTGIPGSSAGGDIYTVTRASKDAPWGRRVSLDSINDPSYSDSSAHISADDLELFFGSSRPGGCGGSDVWVSTRQTPHDPWQTPVNLGPIVNTPTADAPAWLSRDGLRLLLASARPGGFGNFDAWMTTRPSKDSSWGPPRNLGPSINTAYAEALTAVSPDGRLCYISDWKTPRPGGLGGSDFWQVPILSGGEFIIGTMKGKGDSR